MTRKKKRRSALRIAERRLRKQRQQRLTIALAAVAVIAIVAVLIWLNARPVPLIEIQVESPANADGAAWGPADAPVVIQDWSDFG
jgi:hypothetical protein